MSSAKFCLLVAAIYAAPHIDPLTSLIISTFVNVVAVLAWACED